VTSADSHDWRLEGDYFEGCNGDSICPYIFMRDPDDGHCNAIVAWHIETGHYESTQLDGLNAVVVFVAPGNMFTGPKMKAVFYLDKRANGEQMAFKWKRSGKSSKYIPFDWSGP
jgi:hypothetical protein